MYRRTEDGPVFVQAQPPTDEALHGLLHKIISRILEAPVIERILTHLGLAARPPPRSPARLPDPDLLQAA